MRLLLTLMAMAVLVVSIGCDKKAEEAAKPKATGDTAAGTAAVAAPSTGDSSASATTKTAGTQTVSLKLPGMTWGGCESSVRRALTGVDGIADLETNIGERSATFKAPADMDVEAMLNKFADEGNEHIAGWSKADDSAEPADNDGAATSKKSGAQTVSLKLPGMTWGGCASSVRRALNGVEGVADIETDTSKRSCTFSAPADLDVEAVLNKIADEGNKHIAGWSKVE